MSSDTIWLPQAYLLGTPEQTRRIAAAVAHVVEAADTLATEPPQR